MVIAGLKATGSTTAHASNSKRLVDLLMQDLVYEVLNSGVKIAPVLLTVLGLGKGVVRDSIKEMLDACSGIIGGIVGFLCQGQHRLICLLVVFNVSVEPESTPWPVVLESLDIPLRLGGKCTFCPCTRNVLYNFLQAT